MSENKSNKVGENIVKCRKMNGMSQTFLAEKIGISVQGLNKIEKGKVGTNTRTLAKIGTILRVTPNQLFGLDPITEDDTLCGKE